jgi:ribose-phosphate pyrophosphokinase
MAPLDPMRDQIVVVSPDAGGVERARAFAKRFDAPLAIVDKRRDRPNQATATTVIGDVEGRVALLVDDIIDTAGTMCAAAQVLHAVGASMVLACATHAVLSGQALSCLEQSEFTKVYVTDTIPLSPEAKGCSKLEVLSVASLLAKTIHNIHTGSSVSMLF